MSFSPTDITQIQKSIKCSFSNYEKVKNILIAFHGFFSISNIKLKNLDFMGGKNGWSSR
jgi:hypothetical protein